MRRFSFWSGSFQVESPVTHNLKLAHVSGIAPIGFLVFYLPMSFFFFCISLVMYTDAKWLQIASAIFFIAGVSGVIALRTNMKELSCILNTVQPRAGILKDGIVSGDTCWEISEQLSFEGKTHDKYIWWTRYHSGIFPNKKADVFVYPLNGRVAVEGENDIVLVTVDAKKLIV